MRGRIHLIENTFTLLSDDKTDILIRTLFEMHRISMDGR